MTSASASTLTSSPTSAWKKIGEKMEEKGKKEGVTKDEGMAGEKRKKSGGKSRCKTQHCSLFDSLQCGFSKLILIQQATNGPHSS